MNTKEAALFVNYLFEISFNIDNIMNFIDKNGDDLNPVASIIAEETGSPICMNCVMEKIGEIACKILSTLPDLIIDDNDNGKYGGSSILKLTLNEDFEFNYSPNEYDGDLMAIVTNKNIK